MLIGLCGIDDCPTNDYLRAIFVCMIVHYVAMVSVKRVLFPFAWSGLMLVQGHCGVRLYAPFIG
jgi:hypothetical protein